MQTYGEQGADDTASGEANGGQSVSGFLPKEFFGDYQCKPGDLITVRVKSVDPDTGEKEVTFEGEQSSQSGGEDAMDAMEKRFPEQEPE